MSIADRLKEAGFKPEVSTEGEWQPYNGTYRCTIKALRVERDEKNACDFVQAEYDIEETLEGDPKRDSKYPAFRKRYYMDFENPTDAHLENVKKLSNAVFTATGLELDYTDKQSFIASAAACIGLDIYIRAWGWKPEKDVKGNAIAEENQKTIQQFSVVKKEVAEKKRSSNSVAF